MKHKFYDTSSLLECVYNLFQEEEETIHISSITLEELENIKTAANKDFEIKYKANQLVKILDKNEDKYMSHIFTNDMLEPITNKALSITNDTKILATAIMVQNQYSDLIFVTNDSCLKRIARLFFFQVESVTEKEDTYYGYIEKTLNDEEMAWFYSHLDENIYDLKTNEYLITKGALAYWNGAYSGTSSNIEYVKLGKL